MIKMKKGGVVTLSLMLAIAGCGDSPPPAEELVPVVPTTETPPAPVNDSAAIRDSVAQALEDSLAAVAATEAAEEAATPSTPAPGGNNSAPTTSQGGNASTIWGGVYTTEQATYGKELYDAVCFACHTIDQWSDYHVMTRHGNTLAGLFGFISEQMPQSEPGSLYPEDYAGIIAYMLALNGIPAGNKELPATYQELNGIEITPNP